ncbi:MAG: hypothetical protein RSF67_06470 [Clostridia bacterium]
MIKIVKKIPLCNNTKDNYSSITYYCDHYYATMPNCNIVNKLDNCLRKVCKFDANIPFNSISNGNECNTFYLSSKDEVNKIYKTDNRFKPLTNIKLSVPSNMIGKIKSIFFNKYECKILITTEKNVYSVTKEGNFIKEEVNIDEFSECKKRNEVSYPNCCNCGVREPVKNKNKNIVFTAGGYFCGYKYVAYTKNNSCYLAKISENGNIIKKSYIGDNITINSIFEKCNNLEFLVTTDAGYNYIYITNLCCRRKCKDCCNCGNDCCYDNEGYCEDECFDCSSCFTECYEEEYCCSDEECCSEHSKCNCEKNICDIIESIAYIEVGLSHILNAEGEKVQKILECSDSCDEILKVNESVNKTIYNITTLEHILLGKLELAKDCLCKKKENECEE